MNSFCTSWYLDLHVGGLTLAASLFFIAFSCSVIEWARYFSALLFTLTTGSGKNKVCFLSLVCFWWPAGERRPELKERKTRRWGLLLLCCWLTEEICVRNTICSGSTVLHTVLCGWLRGEGFTYTNLEGLFFLLVLPFLSHYWFVILLMHHTTQMR